MTHILSILAVLLLAFPSSGSSEEKMDESEAQEMWSEYKDRIMKSRMSQVAQMNAILDSHQLSDDGPFLLDFFFFSSNREDIDQLKKQLGENYTITLEPAKQESYWIAKGTTRPIAIQITREQHRDWVDFMVKVGHSYNCVFSNWVVTDPDSQRQFLSKDLETEYD